jgi:hypothetical protein
MDSLVQATEMPTDASVAESQGRDTIATYLNLRETQRPKTKLRTTASSQHKLIRKTHDDEH